MENFYLAHSFDDFDSFTDFTKSASWDLEFIQLSPGKFRADLVLFGDMDLQIAEVAYNRTLLQRGSAPGGFTFAVHHMDSAPINWRYLDFPANGIIVFPENKEHQGVSQKNHHPFTVTINENFLSNVAEEVGLPEPSRFVPKGEVHLCDPAAIHRIQTFLGSLCATMKSTGKRFAEILINHETKWKIARLFLLALSASGINKPRKRQFSRRKKVVDRVMDYIDADLATPRSILELCHVAEINERTLRNMFYEQFSLSPNKFLKCHRLNIVRSALKRLDSTQVSIADIANQAGFWHMGQFAKDYRRMFGELPSETPGISPAVKPTS